MPIPNRVLLSKFSPTILQPNLIIAFHQLHCPFCTTRSLEKYKLWQILPISSHEPLWKSLIKTSNYLYIIYIYEEGKNKQWAINTSFPSLRRERWIILKKCGFFTRESDRSDPSWHRRRRVVLMATSSEMELLGLGF